MEIVVNLKSHFLIPYFYSADFAVCFLLYYFGDQGVDEACRCGKGASSCENVEYGKPGVIIGDKTETVGACRTAEIAKTVDNSRYAARIHSVLQCEGDHACYDVVNSRHKARGDGKASYRYRDKACSHKQNHRYDKGKTDREEYGAGEGEILGGSLNADGEECAENSKSRKQKSEKN